MQTSRKALPLALGLAIGLGAALPAWADSKAPSPQEESRRASLTRGVVAPAEQAGKTGQFRPGAVAVTLASPAFHAKKADAAAMAREYVTARAAQLGLDKAALANLVVASERADAAFTVVRFQQRAAGLPVYDSDIAVTVAPDGRVLYVASKAVSGVAAVSSKTQAVDEQQALDRARAYLGVGGFVNVQSQKQKTLT